MDFNTGGDFEGRFDAQEGAPPFKPHLSAQCFSVELLHAVTPYALHNVAIYVQGQTIHEIFCGDL
jgi:hypothetical protein